MSYFSASRVGYYQGNEYNETRGIENLRRTTAFAKIYDKTTSTASKSKTQMCRSITSGISCRFGDRCSFAHNQAELKVRKCAFGTLCRTRYSKSNPCRFDHSEENTPEIAKSANFAQEVKSFWDEEQLLAQAVSAWISSQGMITSTKPFLIQIDADSVTHNLEQVPKSEEDDEMRAMSALACRSIGIVQVPVGFNTMNNWIDGRPFLGSSIFMVPI